MKLWITKPTQNTLLTTGIGFVVLLTGCANEFSFKEVSSFCAPPPSSARFGKNSGPVITSPNENTPFNTTMTVAGTCIDGFDLSIRGGGVANAVTTSCNSGTFSTSITFKTGDGTKELDVAQLSMGEEELEIVDRRCFTQDSVPPKVTITGTAGSLAVNTTTVNLEGTCEAGLPVEVSGPQLSSAVTTSCAAGRFIATVTFTGPDGLKDVVARQVDPAGNDGQDNEQYLTDRTPPLVTFTSPSASSLSQGNIVLTGTCEAGPPVILQGGMLSGFATVGCPSGTFSLPVSLSSGDGLKNIVATQTDAARNAGTTNRDFIKDATPPVVLIRSPAANSATMGALTISGACETGLNVTLTDAGTIVTLPCTAGGFSAGVILSSPDGLKTYTATQPDMAGNTASDTRNFYRDSIAPLVAITAPAAESYHGATLTLVGTCETGLPVAITGAGAAASSSATCSAGGFSTTVTLSSGDGPKFLTASQTDGAGNTGSDSRNFNRDSSLPIVTIASPAANTLVTGALTLVGTCEAGLTVNISGAVSAPSTTTCVAGAFSTVIILSIGDGVKNVVASQTDGAGTGSANRSFIKDATAPLVAITAPAAGTGAPNGLTVSGSCETGQPVTLSGDISTVSANCVSGLFSSAIVFTGGLGIKNVKASQTDVAGNTGTNSRTFIKGNNATVETFTSRGPGGKVDILFVDDNSASMDAEQQALGTKFSSFTSALSGVDWQVGMVTTDCDPSSAHNYCGQLFNLTGRPANEYVLTQSTPNYLTVFQNTIQRPETLNCLLNGSCPAGREEGMKSTIQAIAGRDTYNAGFFRNDSDLAVVFLTDEDEASTGPSTATQPSAVISAFQNAWAGTKKFSSYGIIVKPGDTACFNAQRAQFGSNANYGNLISNLTSLTGGQSVSICEPDYSVTLTQIGNDVTRLSKSYDLVQVPITGTVSLAFTPAFSTTFTVNGQRVTLDSIPPMGTQISISYQY